MREILSLTEKTKNGMNQKNSVKDEINGNLKFFQMTESIDDVASINSSFLKISENTVNRTPIIRYRRIRRNTGLKHQQIVHEKIHFGREVNKNDPF